MIKTIFESCKGLNEFILGRRSIAISTKLDYFEGKKDGQLMVIHSLFLDLRLLQLYIYTYIYYIYYISLILLYQKNFPKN